MKKSKKVVVPVSVLKPGTHAAVKAKRAPDREQNASAKRSFRSGRYARPENLDDQDPDGTR